MTEEGAFIRVEGKPGKHGILRAKKKKSFTEKRVRSCVSSAVEILSKMKFENNNWIQQYGNQGLP